MNNNYVLPKGREALTSPPPSFFFFFLFGCVISSSHQMGRGSASGCVNEVRSEPSHSQVKVTTEAHVKSRRG